MKPLIFFCAVLLTSFKLNDASNLCTTANCSLQSPEIRSPFRIQGIQPCPCGLPGFTLYCQDNTTTIHFPGYNRALAVKFISYTDRRLDLIDPKSCTHEVLLNLNISATPFRYYYVLKEYKYINCSDKLGDSFVQVPCLSGLKHHIYIIESVSSLPVSCSVMKAVAIPFPYSPYLSGRSFGLRLTWGPVPHGGEGAHPGILRQRGQSKDQVKVAGIILVFLMVGFILLYATISRHVLGVNQDKKIKTTGEVEVDDGKLLGEYENI